MTEDLRYLWFPVEISTGMTRSDSARLMVECFESRFCHVRYAINTSLLSFNDVTLYSLCCFLFPFPVQLPILAVLLPPYTNVGFSSSTNYLLAAVLSACPYHKCLLIWRNRKLISHNICFHYRIKNIVCLWICCRLIPVSLPVIIYVYL